VARARPDWAVGFADEVRRSRVAPPAGRARAPTGRPPRLVEQAVAKGEPQAPAGYGLPARWREDPAGDPAEALRLRFVDGRPVSGVTARFVDRCCARSAAAGKTALLLVWGNASWHLSGEVRGWIADHNRQVEADGAGGRIVARRLPTQSPWLNPLEPKGVHGNKRVVEPARLPPAAELEDRVYRALGADHADHLTMPQKVA